MRRRSIEITTCSISVAAASAQALFGGFSYLAVQMDPMMTRYSHIKNNDITVRGIQSSLLSFGSHAFFAGLLCMLMSLIALLFLVKNRTPKFSGLLLLLAGVVNSLILFGTGLPVGIIVVIAGIIVITGKSVVHTPYLPNHDQ
ncbi:hypothetical protein ACFP7A_08845 [Sporolactobacillus kofuensis]|uniref:DUF4064 domain-containing protein n=2 Tax=Sporolactobacillus kofuensis TaxID=269672 RepID=A0ABW1WES3_9BACL